MILEIVAARFFAPLIGTSVFVWTSVIGVIMTGLACGYSMGGILGDRHKAFSILQSIVYMAAAWIALLAVVRHPVMAFLQTVTRGPMGLAVTATLALLFFPSLLLGMVSPYAVCLTVRDMRQLGDRVGTLATLSTIGSIFGTFAAGFVLIPLLGMTDILLLCATVLACVTMGRDRGSIVRFIALLLVIAGIFAANRWLYPQYMQRHGYLIERESAYSNIRVRDIRADQSPLGTDIRYLEINSGQHAAYMPNAPTEHVFPYTKYYRLSDAFRPQASRALMLGGGGFTIMHEFLRRHPHASVDIVEIDPEVTKVARQYFGPIDENAVRIVHEDARMFLNRGGPQGAATSMRGMYHVVYGDAFGSDYVIPFHLATVEAAQAIANMLDDQGVYVLNLIASDNGRERRLLDAQVHTLRQVFPQVMAFRVPPRTDVRTTGPLMNIIVVASKRSVPSATLQRVQDAQLRDMLATEVSTSSTSNAMLLTDDFAPVEGLLYL